MNPQDPNHPDLTAYVLGELSPDQELATREWIASSPEAYAELVRIEQVTDALHQGAPVPTAKLYPDQRQAVLNPARSPRFVTPMMPRSPAVRRPSRIAPFLAGMAKLAAAAAIALGAFMLGKHLGGPVSTELATTDQPAAPVSERQIEKKPLRSTPVPKLETSIVAAPTVTPEPAKPQPAVTSKPRAILVAQAPASSAEMPVQAPSRVATQAVAVPAKQPAPPPQVAKAPTASVAASDDGFTITNRNAISRVILRPHETRPAPVRPKGQTLASPLVGPPPQPNATGADRGRAPDLFIHSWKAEVASCPWKTDHKLLRVHIQLPADQPAAVSPDHAYPLQVSFDGISVRSYRLLSKSQHAPLEGSNSALNVLWYEIVPNAKAAEPSRDSGRILATITLPNARFTTQAVGPFDSSKLQALDRGLAWENARDDFLFETAIVGFGLLLRGEDNLGSLNHDLVLTIAERAKGADPGGERARFLKLVRDAKQITGI